MGVAAAGHDESLHPPAFTDDEPAIGSERRPAFADTLFLRAASGGKKLCQALLETREDFPIGRDFRRRAGHSVIARVGVERFRLPAAEQQTAISHPAVGRRSGMAEAR